MYIKLEKNSNEDPRFTRTRELLLNSFTALVIEKESFRSVSVQGITIKAGVNRATFYAHFIDKYDLLNTWVRLSFRQSVTQMLPVDIDFSKPNIEKLVDLTVEHLEYRNKYRRRVNVSFEPMLGTAMQQELQDLLMRMLSNTNGLNNSITLASMASFLSWAVFGAIQDWSKSRKQHPKELIKQELARFLLSSISI